MAADTITRIQKVIAERLDVEESKVVPEARIVEDLNADSLDQVELIMSLEEEFGLEISDEEAEGIQTVQDAISYVEQHAS